MTLLHRRCFAGGLSLVLLSGCDPQESSLGEFPESESSADSDDMSGSATGDASTGADGSVVGLQCELSQNPSAVLLEEEPSDACGGGYCLFAYDFQPPSIACQSDDECGGEDGSFYCDPDSGACALNPEFIADRSMCTQACETTDDCAGADGTACEGGFSCRPVASLGSLCCQSMCVCNDDLNFTAAEDLRESCEQGLIPECE